MLICPLHATWERLAQAPFCSSPSGFRSWKGSKRALLLLSWMLVEAVLLKNKPVVCARVIPGLWQIAETIRNSAGSLIPTWQPQDSFHCLIIRQKYRLVFCLCSLVVADCSRAAGNQGKGTLPRGKQDRAASRHRQILLLNSFVSRGLNLAETRSIKSVF